MKFKYQHLAWDIVRAIELPYIAVTDCRMPNASSRDLSNVLLTTNPAKIELLGMRHYRDHVSRQHQVWGFRLTLNSGDTRIVEIGHCPNYSVRNKMR